MRQVTPDYFVSPQISAEDIPAIIEAGVTVIINNRPDAEIPPSHQAAAMEAAATAAGVQIVHLPITHQTMTSENVAAHNEVIAQAEGKVLAYCASGTRSTVIWALGQAGKASADDILATCRNAGYDLEGLRSALS